MLKLKVILLALVFNAVVYCQNNNKNILSNVKAFTGTGGYGGILPTASSPFGMVQLGPDTRFTGGTSYLYTDTALYGFSHLHKSGGGCTAFQDITFLPTTNFLFADSTYPEKVNSSFSHEQEFF